MEAKRNGVAALLEANQPELLEDWLQVQVDYPFLRLELANKADLKDQSRQFLRHFIGLVHQDDTDDIQITAPQYEPLYVMLQAMTDSRSGQGFTASETASYIFSLREVILRFLRQYLTEQPKIMEREIIRLPRIIDQLGLITFEIFVERSQQIILRQQQEIIELSTPVIHIWEGILALPLIGTLDSVRAQQIMESLLQEIAQTGYDLVILDISGATTVDTLVAQYLLKTVSAAHLMGAECIISGISPSIAQTIVQLGIDLRTVNTTSTLSSALQTAFSRLGLQVQADVPEDQ